MGREGSAMIWLLGKKRYEGGFIHQRSRFFTSLLFHFDSPALINLQQSQTYNIKTALPDRQQKSLPELHSQLRA